MGRPKFRCEEHPGYKAHRGVPVADCDTCWAARGRWVNFNDSSRGKAKGGGRSSKAKGRAGAEAVVAEFRAALPWLEEGDFFIKTTSAGGVDIHLSPLALKWVPFSIESKNTEQLSIWKALKQATANNQPGLQPLLCFKRANSPVYAALRLCDFLQLVCQKSQPPVSRPSPPAPETVGTSTPPSPS